MLHAHGPTLRGRPGREGSLCPSSTSRLVAGPCLSVGGQGRLWPGLCSLPCPLTDTLHLSSRKASRFRRASSPLMRKAMPVSRLAQSRAGTAQVRAERGTSPSDQSLTSCSWNHALTQGHHLSLLCECWPRAGRTLLPPPPQEAPPLLFLFSFELFILYWV